MQLSSLSPSPLPSTSHFYTNHWSWPPHAQLQGLLPISRLNMQPQCFLSKGRRWEVRKLPGTRASRPLVLAGLTYTVRNTQSLPFVVAFVGTGGPLSPPRRRTLGILKSQLKFLEVVWLTVCHLTMFSVISSSVLWADVPDFKNEDRSLGLPDLCSRKASKRNTCRDLFLPLTES